MNSVIWLLIGLAGFATYKIAEEEEFDYTLWAILAALFSIFALVLVVIEK